jgi:hypothetical protein
MQNDRHTSQGGRFTDSGARAGGAIDQRRSKGAIPRRRVLGMGLTLQTCGGLLVYGASLLGLPISTAHLAQFEALNRELGKLCSKPPPQALNVCRLHARLINGF